jgi:hypothetical protein
LAVFSAPFGERDSGKTGVEGLIVAVEVLVDVEEGWTSPDWLRHEHKKA